jgi:DNA-binding transcriptional MocR family regulator
MPVAFLRLGCDGEEAARRLLARGVASVPGRFFGVRDALRVGLARVRPEEFKEPLAALAEEVGRCA